MSNAKITTLNYTSLSCRVHSDFFETVFAHSKSISVGEYSGLEVLMRKIITAEPALCGYLPTHPNSLRYYSQ